MTCNNEVKCNKKTNILRKRCAHLNQLKIILPKKKIELKKSGAEIINTLPFIAC